ncbi:MAG: transketolase C-terminal domain-containing protein, partial [Nitrososphaerota archaeon]|nr:transketolase C-terminal domain-containing protein [Nitrososphaerota archaeon]
KTNRLVVVDDGHKTGSISAEIAAKVVEESFESLEAPIIRVNSPDMPVPSSPSLERTFMVNAEKIVEAVLKII